MNWLPCVEWILTWTLAWFRITCQLTEAHGAGLVFAAPKTDAGHLESGVVVREQLVVVRLRGWCEAHASDPLVGDVRQNSSETSVLAVRAFWASKFCRR